MDSGAATINWQRSYRSTIAAGAFALLAGLFIAYLWLGNPQILILGLIALAVVVIASDLYRGFYLLLVATQLNGIRYETGIYTLRIEHFILLVMVLVWIYLFLQGRVRWHKTALNKPIFAFLLVTLLSSYLYSPDRAASYRGVFLLLIYVSMYFLTVNVLLEYPDKIRQVIKWFLIITVAHTIWSLIAIATFKTGIYTGGISPGNYASLGLPAIRGLLQESDLMGVVAGVALLMLFSHFISYQDTGLAKKKTLVLAMVPTLCAVVLAMARAAWIGFMVAMFFIVFSLRPKRNVFNPKALALIFAIIVIFALVIFPLVNSITASFSGSEDTFIDRMKALVDFGSGSAVGRVRVQKQALEEWQSSPWLGRGLFSIRGKDLPSGHWLYSTLIQALHDSGIIGLILMLWIHIGIIVVCFRSYGMTEDYFYRATLLGFGLGAILIVIASQASSFFWVGYPWLFMGMAMTVAIIAQEGKTEEPDRSKSAVTNAYSN